MGKVKVSNGTESFEIDGSDLQSAIKDGYKPTERIIVANSKTKESYEIDPNDVESALNDGFSFQDIVKKNGQSQSQPQSTPPTSTEPIKLSKDLLTLAKERKETQGRLAAASTPVMAPGAYTAAPNVDPYKKQLSETNEAIKALGGDDAFADDIADVPTGQGFSFVNDIPTLLKMRKENPNQYNRELSAIKSKGNLYNAIRDEADIQTANNVVQGLQQLEKQDYRAATKEGIALIRKHVRDGDEQNKLIKNYISNKAYEYGVQSAPNDERFAHLNPYQQRAMQFLEDTDQGTFQAYSRLLSQNPDEQWMGSNEADIRRGYETKSKELENMGMNLQMKAYEEVLTGLKNKADSGKPLSADEQAKYNSVLQEYQTLAADKQNQSQRYPYVAAMDADRLMQEALGSKNSVAKKFVLGVGENFDDAINWVGDLLQDKGVAGDLELLGDKEMSGLNRYTSEKDRLIGSDFVAKFDDQLQKQIDEVKNSDLSEDQKQDRVRELILKNDDKINYIANDKAGKRNFTAKSVMNVVGDVASDLVSQLAIGAMTGGGGNASKIKNLSSLFGSTFATAYNDYYNEAIKNNVANPTQYAITHTTIEAATELINDDFEVAKKLAGKGSTLGKVLGNVTKEQWDNIAKKGFFSKLKDAAVQTGKTAIGNALQEAKEEVTGQIAGNVADQHVFNKETGIGEGVKDTFIQTMVGMAPLGLLSLPFNYQNINRTQKYAFYEMGMNPDRFIQAIDTGIQNGTITKEQGEERKLNIEAAARAVKSSTAVRADGEPMTDNEKTEYAFNKAVLEEIKEQKKEAPPETKKELEKKEDEINKVQEELVKPKKPKTTPEQKIINKAIKEGKIPDTIAGEAKKNPGEFFKMVADQVYGMNADGSKSLQPDAEKAAREQFGDQIVDRAIELNPASKNTGISTDVIAEQRGGDGSGNAIETEEVSVLSMLKSAKNLSNQEKRMLYGQYKKGVMTENEISKYTHIDIGDIKDGHIDKWAKVVLDKMKGMNVKAEDIDFEEVPNESEIIINTPDDFERELTKALTVEAKTEDKAATKTTTKEKKTKTAVPKEEAVRPVVKEDPIKKEKPTLEKKEQEMADYAYQNSYPYFKKKFPDVDVDEYNRLRSVKRQQALPKLGEINQDSNRRPADEDVTQYTPQSVLQNAKEFYKNDPLISRVISFLEPIINKNPNIKIDTGFDWGSRTYEGQKITNDALGYSFPSGNLILNFNRIKDYDTLYRTALHEMVHAATRGEINSNKAFNEDLKNILTEVRRAMKLPEGDSVVDALVRNKIISEDYDARYGAANEHELLAEVFTNQKFFEYLKGLKYKGDNMLHRIFLAIAKFFSKKYKAIAEAKENISVDNVADYLMQLTESVIGDKQQNEEVGEAFPLMRPKEREVLKGVISKARGKISEEDIRGKLKQIAGLDDKEIDELLAEVAPVEPVTPSVRSLTEEEIGYAPQEPKRKSAARRFKEKYFDRAKGLPDWILKLKDRAKGTVHLEVRQALQLVDKTKRVAKQIGFEDWSLFDKALRNQFYGSDLADLKALPPEMQVLAVQMRNKIDGLSRDLIINNYVTPEQALNIESNIGEYMTRSYRAFNEKDWSKKVPPLAREDAYRLLVQQRFDELYDPEDPNADVDSIIEEAKADAFNELQSLIDGINNKYTPPKINVQKGKDLGVLKQRQDIPKEIREVLGEYTDPGVNFAMTVARIASLKSSAEYLNSVKNEGLGEIFFEADSRPPEASVEIKSEGSETWNPLNGLYTTPEVKEIFDETEVIRNKWVQLWLKAVGAVKWGKTVGSLVTQVKNFESNLGFAIMNGHYRAGKSGESFKFLKDKLFKGERSQDQMIEKVIRLGLVDQSVGVRELKDMFAADDLDKVIVNSSIKEKSAMKKIADTVVGKPVKYLNKVYGASDDFWKVYGFLNEAESLSRVTYDKSYKDLTEEEQAAVDIEASERIKNTYPTYDRVWEGAKSLSKGLPVFGNFLSFQAESIRVLLNTFNYAIDDLKSDDRKMLGVQRLAGIGAYLSARTMILYTIAQMTGVGMAGLLGMASDDDEDQKLKDINRFSPEFIKSGDKLAMDHGDGKYTVYDVGSLEPYGVWFKTMNAYTEGNDIVKDGGIGASAAELLSPFVEPEMSFKMGLNLYNNENDFGGRIYNPTDGMGDKMLDAMGYVITKAKPSTIDLIQRVYEKENKTNEISAVFGGRGYDVDIPKNFSFKLKAAENLFDANRDALNKVKYGGKATEEEIEEAQKVFEERTSKIVKMLAEDYQAAIRLGAKIERLDEVLDRKKFFQGYNKNIKNQIKSGVVDEGSSSSDQIKEWE